MTDRELLELAAKAAGIDVNCVSSDGVHSYDTDVIWNPLTDDGDAFRLAAILGLSTRYETSFPPDSSGGSVYVKARLGYPTRTIEVNHSYCRTLTKFKLREDEIKFAEYMCRPERDEERWMPSEESATRRAIVRASAEIGKSINNTKD